MKKRKITVCTLILTLALSLSAMMATTFSAMAEESNTYRVSNLFSGNTSGTVGTQEDSSDSKKYTSFTFTGESGNSVSYKQDMAYRWYTEQGAQYFSMRFKFDAINFTTFTITFESAENSTSKEEKATNKIVFSNENQNVTAKVNDGNSFTVNASADINLAFSEKNSLTNEEANSGEYYINYNNTYVGTFENIGGTYVEYSSTSCIPLTFSAKVPNDTDKKQVVLFKELNGQSLAVNADDKIVDDTAPVLCINEQIKTFIIGSKYSFHYQAVDVCDASVSTSLYYNQYSEAEGYTVDFKDTAKKYTSSTKIWDTDVSKTHNGEEYILIYCTLKDDSGVKQENIQLTWYAKDSDLATFNNYKYFKVTKDSQKGPEYLCVTNDSQNKTSTLDNDYQDLKDYEQAVSESAKNVKAGSGYYYYVPSLEDLFEDDDTYYSGLSFTIYYQKVSGTSTSWSTNSSLSYSNLKIPVSTAGDYKFKVVAKDKNGNSMYFYQSGRLVEVSSANVGDIEAIPEFRFTVNYYGIEVKDAEEETIGYNESSYTFSSYDVKGMYYSISDSSAYTKENPAYTLYLLEDSKGLGYSALIDLINGLKDNALKTNEIYNSYDFKKINEFDDSIDEDKQETLWKESDNAYHWSPKSSLTFVPQKVGYYILQYKVIGTELGIDESKIDHYSYKVIKVNAEKDELFGEINWAENNVTSIVFLSIAGASLIGIIVLLVIKPSNEKIEDIDVVDLDSTDKKNKKVRRGGKK